MMVARWRVVKVSELTTRQQFQPAASDARALSTLAESSTGIAIDCTLNEAAAASNGRRKNDPPPGAVVGLNMKPTRVMLGASSLRISNHFPPTDASRLVKPVTLPPG